MNLNKRLLVFAELGEYLSEDIFKVNDKELYRAEIFNPWFTQENIKYSLLNWSKLLNKEMLSSWLIPYKLDDLPNNKNVLIIMAGNIPLVGFHDLLTALICGCNVTIKMSSNDSILIKLIIQKLIEIDNSYNEYISFIDDLNERCFDAVITAGSNNSSRYFNYYFKDIPKIIRKNRCSVAILDGNETELELKGLAKDIFLYFGLGCRNVSKLFLPSGYDLDLLFNHFYKYAKLLEHKKYANNYDYYKAIHLLGKHKLIENGFLLMKEDNSLFSPISMLYYEFYNDRLSVNNFLNDNTDNIQSIISRKDIPFGEAQRPKLWDYADNIDTVDFLKKI